MYICTILVLYVLYYTNISYVRYYNLLLVLPTSLVGERPSFPLVNTIQRIKFSCNYRGCINEVTLYCYYLLLTEKNTMTVFVTLNWTFVLNFVVNRSVIHITTFKIDLMRFVLYVS